jgi:hypothetical protein
LSSRTLRSAWRWVPALLAVVVTWMAWRCAKNNLPIALFGGLAVWWLASWALCAA